VFWIFFDWNKKSFHSFCNETRTFLFQALMWSEYFSGRTALGKTVFGIWTPASFPPKTDRNNFSFKRPLHFLNTISFFHFSAILENAIGEDGRELNAQDIDWLGNK
jgi:hypothetical protein